VPDKIIGLPAHPLVVHAAVVLVPLAVIAFAVLCWKTEWRKSYLLPVTLLSIAGGVAALLAKQSGEPLQHSIRTAARAAGQTGALGDHPEQGDTAFVWAFLFMCAVVAYWAVLRWGSRWSVPSWAPKAGYYAVLVPGAIALVTMMIAGHSGAALVWKDVGTFKVGA
jgi:uncharacterized membrane protein